MRLSTWRENACMTWICLETKQWLRERFLPSSGMSRDHLQEEKEVVSIHSFDQMPQQQESLRESFEVERKTCECLVWEWIHRESTSWVGETWVAITSESPEQPCLDYHLDCLGNNSSCYHCYTSSIVKDWKPTKLFLVAVGQLHSRKLWRKLHSMTIQGLPCRAWSQQEATIPVGEKESERGMENQKEIK